MKSVRSIHFTVDGESISPASPQWAGIQGEHQATLVSFSVPSEWSAYTYQYRIEYIDGMQGFHTSELLSSNNNKVEHLLPSSWTAAGGVGEIRLVAYYEGKNATEQQLIYSMVGRLTFSSREDGLSSEIAVQNDLSYYFSKVEKTLEKYKDLLRISSFEQGECIRFGNKMMIYFGNTDIEAGVPCFIHFPDMFENQPIAIINKEKGTPIPAGDLNTSLLVLYDKEYSGNVGWLVFGKEK